MSALLTNRYQEIARAVTSFEGGSPEAWRRVARQVGFFEQARSIGQTALAEVYAISSLVRSGQITSFEGDSYGAALPEPALGRGPLGPLGGRGGGFGAWGGKRPRRQGPLS